MATTIFASTNGTSQPLSEKWLYIYGIIPTEDDVLFDVNGIDSLDAEVYTVSHGGVAAVVSRSTYAEFQGMSRQEAVGYLVAHQQVVEAVMQDFAVLPVKFGTMLADEAQVRILLEQGAELFRSALDTIAHRLQMELVVLWDPTRIFAEISNKDEIIQRKARIAGRPPEETLAERVELGKLVHALMEQCRASLHEQVTTALQSAVLDMVVNPVMDDSMVTNLALLIDQEHRHNLDVLLEALDTVFDGQFTFRCVGPLPPYSFATVDIQVPVFAEVDASRQLLGLDETVAHSAIKRAYHHLAGQSHPDYNPANMQAEQRMTELTQAYQLLSAYAQSQHLKQQPEAVVCDFRREAVERTLLISVRRQDVRL